MKESIQEKEKKFIDEFNELEDWFFQYDYLLSMASELEQLPAEECTDENRVKGCQSGVWIKTGFNPDGTIHIRAASEALIVKGLVAVIVYLLNDRHAGEIASYEQKFIDKTNIKDEISTDRFKGLSSVINVIKGFASAVLTEKSD